MRALELVLVPWTCVLAIAPLFTPSIPWFPSRTVHIAWILFGVALLLALHSVAIAISIDALLTVVQAVWWNAPRISGVLPATTIALACIGPSLAAVVLWDAERRMKLLRAVAVSIPR